MAELTPHCSRRRARFPKEDEASHGLHHLARGVIPPQLMGKAVSQTQRHDSCRVQVSA